MILDIPQAISIIISLVSAIFAGCLYVQSERSLSQAKELTDKQWERDDLAVRRDVLRRIVGYRYRLTESLSGQDGEPFIALNEALVVFAGYPQVKNVLAKMLIEPNPLAENYVSLVKTMADATKIAVDDIDAVMLERPFTPRNAD